MNKQSNPASALIERVLLTRQRTRQEPDEYSSLSEVLCVLREISGLTQEEVAFRLGIAVGTLARAESGMPGTMFQFVTLEKVSKLAGECYLPKMVDFVRVISLFQRNKKQRGPKKNEGPFWEMKLEK